MRTIVLFVAVFLAWDSFGQLIDGDNLRKQKFYDSTLNGMRLRDAASIERIVGTTENIVGSDDEQTEVVNEAGDQLLTMTFHPGDVVNQFSQFKVEYNTEKKTPKLKIKQAEFRTGKGIRLGATEEQLTQVLGPPKEKKKQGIYWAYYYKQDKGLYFGHYYFQNKKLVKFWFGEEYP
jgi:hypothetical protein